MAVNKPRSTWILQNFLSNKLRNYLLTDPLRELFKNLETFFRQKHTQAVHFKLATDEKSQAKEEEVDFRPEDSALSSADEQSDDYLEILKLRHINLTKCVFKLSNIKIDINVLAFFESKISSWKIFHIF